MTDEYEIPAGEAGMEPGTYLATLVALKPFTLYETAAGWTRTMPEDGNVVEAYNKIAWRFATDDEQEIEGTTSTARSERSTLFAWATGLGMTPAVVLDRSKPIPASQLIGREGMITVVLDKNGYSKIASVVPAPRVRQPVQPLPPAPVNQPMTTLPNQAQPGEFSGAPATPPVEAPTADLPF